MILNLWNDKMLLHDFMELYNISNSQMCNIIQRIIFENEDDYIKVFCEETEIKLDTFDIGDNIVFYGKIISTTIDDFEHIKNYGLLTIDKLLENDSPISRHLKKYDVEIKPSEHVFHYKSKKYYIPSYGEECKWCAYGETCKYQNYRYKDMFCHYRESIIPLSSKLYSDNAEIEVFLYGTCKSMINYSTVKKYPEILYTIEEFIKEFIYDDLSICSDWNAEKQHSCIITVPIAYKDVTYRSDYISSNDVEDANDLVSQYSLYLNDEYECIKTTPKCFFENIWMISLCLGILCGMLGDDTLICAGIKHDVNISYNDISINLI